MDQDVLDLLTEDLQRQNGGLIDFNVIFTCTTKETIYTVSEMASMTSTWTWSMCDQVGLYMTAWVTCNVFSNSLL